MSIAVSVILIRENAEQMTGSGCCGKLEGDDPMLGKRRVFQESRAHQQQLGVLHRTVREFFARGDFGDQVAIVTVDPRNQLYLAAKLWRDVWRFRPGWYEGLRTALQLFSIPAVVVNGRVVSRRSQLVDPDSLCHLIASLLETGGASIPR